MGEVDPFPYYLARDLGMHISEVRAMPYAEYLEWRAFYQWERWNASPGKEMNRRG